MEKRILLKVSGEIFQNDNGGPFDHSKYNKVAEAIVKFKKDRDVEIAIVVGAGNIWRARDNQDLNMDRVESDKMGMVATNFNAKNLEFHLKENGAKAQAMTAAYTVNVPGYDVEWARGVLDEGGIVILAGGTGNPYFTTDSAAAVRSLELQCDLIMKATKVDGIYSADPVKDPKATRYSELTYDKILKDRLHLMDLTAIALCRDNDMPVYVFDFTDPSNLEKAFADRTLGTIVRS